MIQIEIDDFESAATGSRTRSIQSDRGWPWKRSMPCCAIGTCPFRRLAMEITRGANLAIAGARADAEASLNSGAMPMTGKAIVSEINRVFGDNTILVKENGGQDLWVYYWALLSGTDQECCVAPAEQTAMGYGIIGAMAANWPHRNARSFHLG